MITQESKSRVSKNIQTKAPVEFNSIQRLACQIHYEYGGSDIDNWLEAEQIIKNESFSPKNR